jgi:hypothetical protein
MATPWSADALFGGGRYSVPDLVKMGWTTQARIDEM